MTSNRNFKSIKYPYAQELSFGYILSPNSTLLSQFLYFFQAPSFAVFRFFSMTSLFTIDVMPSDHQLRLFQYIQSIALEKQYYIEYLVVLIRFVNVYLSAIVIVQIFEKFASYDVTNRSRDHTFCLITSKWLKITYIPSYKSLFRESRVFD